MQGLAINVAGRASASAQDDPLSVFCHAMAPAKQVAEALDGPGSALDEPQAAPRRNFRSGGSRSLLHDSSQLPRPSISLRAHS